MRWLTAIPVYNEAKHLGAVLREVRRYSPDILVVNDGSTDGTGDLLAREPGLRLITHPHNRGYGAALASAFRYADARAAPYPRLCGWVISRRPGSRASRSPVPSVEPSLTTRMSGL